MPSQDTTRRLLLVNKDGLDFKHGDGSADLVRITVKDSQSLESKSEDQFNADNFIKFCEKQLGVLDLPAWLKNVFLTAFFMVLPALVLHAIPRGVQFYSQLLKSFATSIWYNAASLPTKQLQENAALDATVALTETCFITTPAALAGLAAALVAFSYELIQRYQEYREFKKRGTNRQDFYALNLSHLLPEAKKLSKKLPLFLRYLPVTTWRIPIKTVEEFAQVDQATFAKWIKEPEVYKEDYAYLYSQSRWRELSDLICWLFDESSRFTKPFLLIAGIVSIFVVSEVSNNLQNTDPMEYLNRIGNLSPVLKEAISAVMNSPLAAELVKAVKEWIGWDGCGARPMEVSFGLGKCNAFYQVQAMSLLAIPYLFISGSYVALMALIMFFIQGMIFFPKLRDKIYQTLYRPIEEICNKEKLWHYYDFFGRGIALVAVPPALAWSVKGAFELVKDYTAKTDCLPMLELIWSLISSPLSYEWNKKSCPVAVFSFQINLFTIDAELRKFYLWLLVLMGARLTLTGTVELFFSRWARSPKILKIIKSCNETMKKIMDRSVNCGLGVALPLGLFYIFIAIGLANALLQAGVAVNVKDFLSPKILALLKTFFPNIDTLIVQVVEPYLEQTIIPLLATIFVFTPGTNVSLMARALGTLAATTWLGASLTFAAVTGASGFLQVMYGLSSLGYKKLCTLVRSENVNAPVAEAKATGQATPGLFSSCYNRLSALMHCNKKTRSELEPVDVSYKVSYGSLNDGVFPASSQIETNNTRSRQGCWGRFFCPKKTSVRTAQVSSRIEPRVQTFVAGVS